MGVTNAFKMLFGNWKKARQVDGYFQMLDGYTPVFTSYDGGVYEMELTRSCIHTFATHCSKLQPNVTGADLRGLMRILNTKPNPLMTGAQFLYKTATIFEAQNTCFIVPVLNEYDSLVGYYPVNPLQTELVDVGGEPWLRYTFIGGQTSALPLSMCGVVSKFLYKHDLIGEDNRAFDPTMNLLDTQNQGIAEGIKNSASFRFMATVNNFAKNADLAKEREDWVTRNLGHKSGGLALFPNTYTNVQQVQSAAKVVDPEQMKIIQDRAFYYFGTNESILENKAVGDDWAAYYEGKVEPFALQLSQAMTCMTFSPNEIARDNAIFWSANRLQYMSNADKLQVSSQMFDRGILSFNDVMDIWNLPHVPDGDKRYIRKEYIEVSQLSGEPQATEKKNPEGGTENANTGE